MRNEESSSTGQREPLLNSRQQLMILCGATPLALDHLGRKEGLAAGRGTETKHSQAARTKQVARCAVRRGETEILYCDYT